MHSSVYGRVMNKLGCKVKTLLTPLLDLQTGAKVGFISGGATLFLKFRPTPLAMIDFSNPPPPINIILHRKIVEAYICILVFVQKQK